MRPTVSRPRDTYNYVQCVPGIDSFCTFGGAGFYQSGQTGTNHTDCFNFTTNKWERKGDSFFHGIGAMTAYDPIAKRVWGKGTGDSPSYEAATTLADWDPAQDMFTARDKGNADLAYAYYITAAIDPRDTCSSPSGAERRGYGTSPIRKT